ncbi:MAG: hypothetical protein PHV13_03475 [Candidatus ainarchaeum sp.]|nr:hypothetical protein [Candidatus ainarchaeum sp.]
MRIMLIALSMLLLLGCTQQPTENPTPANGTPNATVPADNQTQPVQNLTPGESVINESNMTAQNASTGNVSNISNGTLPNATANATAPLPAGIQFGNYSLVLDDVSIIPSSSEPCGIFSIAANGTVVDRFVACPGQSRTWIAPDGHAYRIFVKKVAAGYGGTEWADVTIFG